MSTINLNSDPKRDNFHSSNWMAKRSLTLQSLSTNWAPNSKRIWMHRCRKNNEIFRMPWFRWLKIIWFGYCSGGEPSIQINFWRDTKSICNMHWEFAYRTDFWTSYSDSLSDARFVRFFFVFLVFSSKNCVVVGSKFVVE